MDILLFKDIWPIIFSHLYDDLFNVKNTCKLFNLIVRKTFLNKKGELNYLSNNLNIIHFYELFKFHEINVGFICKSVNITNHKISFLDYTSEKFLKYEENYIHNINWPYIIPKK